MIQVRSALIFAVAFSCVATGFAAAQGPKAFPGALGFGAQTPGGRGGAIVKVTTLASRGKGSLRAALETKGPRIIVFEVGGVIDLEGKSLKLNEPFITIAGQTAPGPGITLIKGGLDIRAHDVVIQHLAIRPGEAGHAKKSDWQVDGITTDGGSQIIIDHCSCTWSTDENLSASGERHEGMTPEDWRKNTSHDITISNCIIAEALSESTHPKGEHSKGTLLHDNVSNVCVINNLYACNVDRNPMTKGGVSAIIVNNWISAPGKKAVQNTLVPEEWTGHEPQMSRLSIVGNVLEWGAGTSKNCSFFINQLDSPVEVFLDDNIAVDHAGQPVAQLSPPTLPVLAKRSFWSDDVRPIPTKDVKKFIAANVGSRPWDRDPIDARIVKNALDRTGKIIHSEQEVGGYPTYPETRRPFDESKWNMKTLQPK